MIPRRFISPHKTIKEIGIDKKGTVIDFKAGSGHWTFAAVKHLGPSGKVIAIDHNKDMLSRLESLSMLHGYGNVITKHSSLLTIEIKDLPLADLSVMANVLSFSKTRDIAIKKVFDLTRRGGKLLAVEWLKENGHIGPPIMYRLSKKELLELVKDAGFKLLGEIDAGHYHYGIVFEKPTSS